ncbi:hypothetical protein BFJ70_g6729 [Fusarium oxysporum]|nr:hypothetical protein BFJ70_g6729 [Fusarium oxysporum]
MSSAHHHEHVSIPGIHRDINTFEEHGQADIPAIIKAAQEKHRLDLEEGNVNEHGEELRINHHENENGPIRNKSKLGDGTLSLTTKESQGIRRFNAALEAVHPPSVDQQMWWASVKQSINAGRWDESKELISNMTKGYQEQGGPTAGEFVSQLKKVMMYLN